MVSGVGRRAGVRAGVVRHHGRDLQNGDHQRPNAMLASRFRLRDGRGRRCRRHAVTRVDVRFVDQLCRCRRRRRSRRRRCRRISRRRRVVVAVVTHLVDVFRNGVARPDVDPLPLGVVDDGVVAVPEDEARRSGAVVHPADERESTPGLDVTLLTSVNGRIRICNKVLEQC